MPRQGVPQASGGGKHARCAPSAQEEHGRRPSPRGGARRRRARAHGSPDRSNDGYPSRESTSPARGDPL
eukprot:gene21895-65229_t